MSVRTAASASSRDGLGMIGSGAARTCSDRAGLSAGEALGQGLTTASIAVSPFDRPSRPGVSPGRPHQPHAWEPPKRDGRTPHSHLHGFHIQLRARAKLPGPAEGLLLAPTGSTIYIPVSYTHLTLPTSDLV